MLYKLHVLVLHSQIMANLRVLSVKIQTIHYYKITLKPKHFCLKYFVFFHYFTLFPLQVTNAVK